ncbi:Rho GTPase-activating protein 19 [Mactra antiquata]
MVCTPVKREASSEVKSYNRMKAKYCNKKNHLLNLNINMKKMSLSEDSTMLDNDNTHTETKINIDKLRADQPGKLAKFCKKRLSMLINVGEEKFDKLFVGVTSIGNEAYKKKNVLSALKNKKKHNSNTLPKCDQINGNVFKGINKLMDFLQTSECLKNEGIFRKTGNVTRQRTLKDLVQQGSYFDLNDSTFSPHDVATVLKQLISDLPEPLFQFNNVDLYQHLNDMNGASDVDNESVRENMLKSYQLLMLLLPRENVDILERLLVLLHKAANVSENKMSASSLGLVFSPSLLCSRNIAPEQIHSVYPILNKAATNMIENAPRIFDIPRELAGDIAGYFNEISERQLGVLERKKMETDGGASELLSTRTISCSENNVYKCKSVKQANRKTLKESLMNHLSNLVKSKSRDTNEPESEVDCRMDESSKQVRTSSVDDIISHVRSDDKSPSEQRHSPAVFVVDLGASTTSKQSSNADFIVDQLTTGVMSPITISVGKMSLETKKAIMTPGSRMPIYL